jgi:hypothetical protein
VRIKPDVQIFYPRCQCGGPLADYKWCRQCNLVFCQNCFPAHVTACPRKPAIKRKGSK